MAVTRAQLTCPVYGIANELETKQLPNIREVMQHFSFIQTQFPTNIKTSDIAIKVATNVLEIWNKASIPTVSAKRVQQKIESLRKALRVILKRKGEAKNTAFSLAWQESSNLFDIAECQCLEYNNCACPRDAKVPTLEREFLLDQRNERKMVIGCLDKETTNKLSNKSERALKRQRYYESITCDESNAAYNISIDEIDPNSSDDDDKCEDSENNEESESETESSRNMTKFPTVARECDRYGISDTAGAAIATAVLVDYGIIKKDDRIAIIDRAKLRRQRQQLRTSLMQKANVSLSESAVGPKAIFFDGRKDKTMCSTSRSGKRFQTEEHVTILEQPNSVFLGHVSPESGSSLHIKMSIVDYFIENQIPLDNIVAIGADGTNVNTGAHNGVIRLLELHIGHALQWFICLYHFNELPLRHLMLHLDGTTTGPTAFSGTIGKQLQNCQELPVTKFEAKQNNLPTVLQKVTNIDISKDQKYLFEMCRAIEAGELTQKLATKDPGPMVHSRWLTTANRILRLYVSSTSPSRELLLMTDYVLKVYAPIWFSIKLKPQCYMGARHLWHLIQLSRFLPENERTVVDKCIQRNAYFGHPENIILSMLVDERKEIRELAARRIKLAREATVEGDVVRKFQIPPLNFATDDYHSLVDWQELPRTQPPMLKDISDAEIENAIQTQHKWTLDTYPCHTQDVERHVKLVTEAAVAVCGHLRRDGYIRATLESRKDIPCFSSKKDWKIK